MRKAQIILLLSGNPKLCSKQARPFLLVKEENHGLNGIVSLKSGTKCPAEGLLFGAISKMKAYSSTVNAQASKFFQPTINDERQKTNALQNPGFWFCEGTCGRWVIPPGRAAAR